MDIEGIILGLSVTFFELILFYYAGKMIKNIYKQPETAMAKIYLKEKAVWNFKMLTGLLMIYGAAGPLLGAILFLQPEFPLMGAYEHLPLAIAVVSLAGLTYFQKNLYHITAPHQKNGTA